MATALHVRPEDVLALARTLYGEARGEGAAGLAAVAWVVRNRLARPGWWSRERGDGIPDDTIEAVCLDPKQFSCWNGAAGAKLRQRSLAQCGRAGQIAEDVLQGRREDPTNGATHYHTIGRPEGVKTWPPVWAQEHHPCATILRHVFYRI